MPAGSVDPHARAAGARSSLERGPTRRSHDRTRAHRAPAWASPLIALLALGLAGCDEITSLGDDGGLDSTLAWNLAVDPATGLEPGQTILVAIEGDIPEDAIIWVDVNSDDSYGVPLFQPMRGPSDAETLQIPVPILTPGRHTLHLGTTDRLESNEVEVEVVEPPRRRSQDEVAALLRNGFTAYAEALKGILTTAEDARTQEFLDSITGPHADGIAEWFDIVAATAEVAGEVYAEIPEDEERRFQAALHHAGVLDRLEAMVAGAARPAGAPSAAGGAPSAGLQQAPVLRFFPHPIHAHLFLSDLMVAAGHAQELTLSILTLVAGGEANRAAATAGTVASLASRLARFGLQAFVPTEIVSIEAHHQAMVYENQRIRELWWGHLRPQERWSEGAIELAADVIATGMAQGWGRLTKGPGKSAAAEFWERLIGDLLSRISSKVGLLVVREFFPESGYFTEIKTVLNPGAFRFVTSFHINELQPALVLLGPPGYVLSPVLLTVSNMLWLHESAAEYLDIDVTTWGLSARGGDPLGVEAADGFLVDYEEDEIYFPHLGFTETGPQQTVAEIEMQAFNWGTAGWRFLGDIPVPEPADPVSHAILINNYPGPVPRDEKPYFGASMIMDEWYTPAGDGYDWLERGRGLANADRRYRFFIGDGNSLCHQVPREPKKARAAVRFENAATSDGRTELPMRELDETGAERQDPYLILARPGLSRVIVEAQPATDCGYRTSSGYFMWVQVGFPDAFNQRTIYDIRSDDAVTSTIPVWTPPCFEPCGGS